MKSLIEQINHMVEVPVLYFYSLLAKWETGLFLSLDKFDSEFIFQDFEW